MLLSSLTLAGYRNYKNLECIFSPGVNMVTGANAQGKTNLIEAVYYFSVGKAYRQARDEQLVQWGGKTFYIKGDIKSRQGASEIEVRYDREANPAKSFAAGGLQRVKWEEISGIFNSVLFSPESMAVIKGSPQERRNFLDYDIAQVSLAYSADLYKYKRLLAQRNALLKKLGPLPVPLNDKKERLAVWDQQLVLYGSRIAEKRMAFLEKMAPLVRLTHRKLTDSKEKMEIQYIRYTKDAAPLAGDDGAKADAAIFLERARDCSLPDDLRFGSTQWGPHRDDLKILLDGVDMKLYGSQGQQRTGILALKLAELEIFRGESGEYPVLLLDDVMSELDENRQRQLLNIINEKFIQCIITATEAKNTGLTEKRLLKQFLVNRGEIREA